LLSKCYQCSISPADEAVIGLAPGGRMRQEIYNDPYSIHDWDMEHSSRCFIHIVNSASWTDVVGEKPPTLPPTAREYTKAGLPWFDYYDKEQEVLNGSKNVAHLKSVKAMGNEKRTNPLPENESVTVSNLVNLRSGLKPNQVRESELF
jgi:hypothetical protein